MVLVWQIKRILDEVNRTGRLFLEYSKENKQEMCCGIWKLKYCGKLLWVCNSCNGKKCFDVIRNGSNANTTAKEKTKKRIKEILGMRYRDRIEVSDINNIHKVDCIMCSATGDFYFYYWSEKIVKKKVNKEECKSYEMLLKNGYWDFFESPVVLYNEEFITERMVLVNKNLENSRNKYIYILNKYKDYFSKVDMAGKIELSELLSQYFVELPNISNIFSQELMNAQISLYYMHGDMWTDNVLQEDKKYYVIDYDNAGVYPFFFDILEYIWAVYINSGVMMFWNELNDDKDDVAQIYNDILVQQGFSTNYKTKFALMVLMGMMRYHIYTQRFKKIDGKENRSYKYIHYELLVKFTQKYMEFLK